MSHPEIPRVEFFGDGLSMNVEQAVSRFRDMLHEYARQAKACGRDEFNFKVDVQLRECDCSETLEGRDDYCPLHGDPEKIRESDEATARLLAERG